MPRAPRSIFALAFAQYFGFALLISLSLLVLASASKVQAQTDGTTDVDPLTLDVSPQYPTPFDVITITPSSTVFDIDNATITVKVNGTTVYTGSGGAGISVPLGGPGSTSNIVLTAVAGGQAYSKTLSIHPADVALVVEPVSSTHPFYAGEALVPSEGRVRLIAIPDLRTSSGHALAPASLEYTWSLGDQVLDSDSGIGKSVLDATAPQQYRDADISVTVTSPDGSIVAQANTTISPITPMTRIYEEDPLLGPLFDNALTDSFAMTDAEDTFLGVPYYFSNTPSLDWTVNGSDSGADPDITLRSTGSGSGTATISFSANDLNTSQSANSTVSVEFGQQNSTGLFGL